MMRSSMDSDAFKTRRSAEASTRLFMLCVMFRYRETVLNELARHGIIPRDDTPPQLIHEFINALYVYEIRSLRKQMRAGLIPKEDYASRVEELHKRYPILALPLGYWIEIE